MKFHFTSIEKSSANEIVISLALKKVVLVKNYLIGIKLKIFRWH